MSDTLISRREHANTWTRPTTETHRFELKPYKGYVLEVEDVHFHHDSAVLLPDYGNAPDPNRITGLAVLASAYSHARQNPARQLLVAGHTDTTGQDDYNLGLSRQRADSVLYALLGDRANWVSLSKSKHKVEDYQQIVKWAAWTYGWDSDPGAIDNVHGAKTTAAVKSFQKNYNAEFGGSLAVDGVVGEKTWGAIFDVYMDHLKSLMKVDDAGLAAARAGLKFLPARRVGCGENFPIEAPRQNNYRSKINRRVELLFFDPDQVPQLDCHPGSACKPIECEVYNPKMYKYTHIPPLPVPPKVQAYDLTNVQSPDHLAPGKEKIKIEYDIVNQGNAIASAKLEILRKKDNKVLQKFDLAAAQYTHGHHNEFEWDGAVSTDKEFPDGFATIEHSPYIAKVTVTGAKGDRTGSAEIQVELKEFKIELAPKAVLTKDADKSVYDQAGSLPAGSLVKLKLQSNIYTIDAAGDEKTDQSGYTLYSTMWGGGPRIPIYATATVIDSKGNAVVCGKAMGRAKVLWDFTDPKQSLDTYLAVPLAPPPATNKSGGAKPFIDKALAYDKTATRPKNGDNCHLDRGGKRVSASGPPIFHGADGGTQNFPFTVNKGNTRFWGCFADFEKSGADEGRAGAIFRPSRFAGDNYSVTAYLDLTFSLDTADDTPAGALRQVKVGDFEIWRLVNVVQHFKKGPQTTGAMPSFAEYYADAFIEVQDDRGGVKDTTKADYDADFPAAFAAAGGNALVRKYGLAPGSQWDAPVPTGAAPPPAASPSVWIATFLPYNQFRSAVSAGEGKTGAALQTLLNSNSCGDSAAHADRVQSLCLGIAKQMCRKKANKDGITVLQFGGTSNLEGLSSFPLNGLAIGQTTAADRAKAGFLLCQTNAQAAQTPAHEIGHLMFLPHSPRLKADGTVINSGGGITPDFHDGANLNCLMSYARPRPGFCGLCLLRLRGWKGDEFDRNGPKTTK